MEANGNDDNDDFKRTTQINYDYSSSGDGSFSNNGGKWPKTERYNSLNRNPKDDLNRDRSLIGKGKENFQENNRKFKELRQLFVLQPPAAFPPYAYNTTDHSCIDNSRRAVSMMPFNLLTPMNNNMHWSINPIDGMPMSPNNMPINPSSTSMPMTAGMEMTQHANSSMNPYASYMGMAGDNMFGMMGMGNLYSYGMMNCQQNVLGGTVKELVHLTGCVLYPPKPTDSILTRPRPPGCKTVFVGNLPEKITEEIIREVFERCGEILKIRMNPKSFCHVKFTDEEFVDRALYFSGYRMKIENKDDQPYTGRLHVDYAEARDDARDFECKQRSIQREARHRQRQEDESKVPTPPPVVHYSEHEVTELTKKLKKEETFQEAGLILISWLENGDCTKRNAGTFFSMIQSISSHINRLKSKKAKYNDELQKTRAILKNQMQNILLQFNEIEKVFNTASLSKVWNYFTKGQQKNIELWKKQTEEIKNVHEEEVLNDRAEDEMDICEDKEVIDEGAIKENSGQRNELEEDISKLEDLNNVLRCQVEAAENEMMVLRADSLKSLDDQKHVIQGLMQVLKNKTITLNQKRAANENNHFAISESDARLLGLLSSFLHVHPNGATIEYLYSYLKHFDSSIQPKDVETLMRRFPTIYIELDSIGIGDSLVKKWVILSYFDNSLA